MAGQKIGWVTNHYLLSAAAAAAAAAAATAAVAAAAAAAAGASLAEEPLPKHLASTPVSSENENPDCWLDPLISSRLFCLNRPLNSKTLRPERLRLINHQ